MTLEAKPAAKTEAEEILEWKAEQSFGAPALHLRLSMQPISPDREGKARYFATAIKLSVIDEYESVFEAFGWKAGLILPLAVSEANWLIVDRSLGDSMLISGQNDGFTALLLRGSEPSVVQETFPFDQSKERWSMYQMKKVLLPWLYWHKILKGKM